MAVEPETEIVTNPNVNDPTNVLYLHPSDNPNNVLVSDVLNGDSYAHWKKAIEIALIAKNKLGFVDGTCKRPTGVNAALAPHWDWCDKMVISWLMNAVVKDIAQSILFSPTAKDIWTQLEQRFGETDGTKVFRIQRDLVLISQGDLSVTDYFTQIKKLWDAYDGLISIPNCSCGLTCASLLAAQKLIQDQHLIQFLVGLHEDYRNVRGNILVIKPLPSIDQVYHLVLQEEKQRNLSSIPHQSAGRVKSKEQFPNLPPKQNRGLCLKLHPKSHG